MLRRRRPTKPAPAARPSMRSEDFLALVRGGERLEEFFQMKRPARMRRTATPPWRAVFAGEGGDAGGIHDAKMGLVEDDVIGRADEPGEEFGLPVTDEGFVADEIGIRGDEMMRPGPRFSPLGQDRAVIFFVEDLPGGIGIFQDDVAVPFQFGGQGQGGNIPGQVPSRTGGRFTQKLQAPLFPEVDEFRLARSFLPAFSGLSFLSFFSFSFFFS